MKRTLLAVLVALAASALVAQQPISDAEILSASEKLLKSPEDAKAWQTFREIIRADNAAPEIGSRVMYLYAVSHLLHMNTNLFVSAMQALQTRYPEEGASLAKRLTPDDWLVRCPECGGTGVGNAAPPAGQKGPSRCLACVGTGRVFQLGARVKEQVGAVLAEIKALAAENIQFAEASKKALSEKVQQRRLTALRELVDKYAHRKDLKDVKQALAQTEAEVAEAEEAARKREELRALREREERDYQAICASIENLPDSGIPVMVREIDGFIEKYPQSANRLSLEIRKSKLLQRQKIRAYIWKGFCLCTGLAVFSFLLALVRDLFARKKKKTTGPQPIPGLSSSTEESDPLAGTFADDDRP